jgi:hypothetical protein
MNKDLLSALSRVLRLVLLRDVLQVQCCLGEL